MSEADASKEKKSDPMEMFRGMRDAYLSAMAKTMQEAVKTEAYAQTSGAILDSYLTASGPAKEALDKSMLQTLEQLSLPSRADVLSLSERFTNVELRLDDMDAKLDGLIKLLKGSLGATAGTKADKPSPAAKAPATKPAAARKATKS